MPHDASLIATIAAAFGLAMILGFIAVKLRMPPLVGYLVAGIVIGPHTRGFVGDVALAGQLADIGVMLLMFGVGLHFSINDLLEVRGLALPARPGPLRGDERAAVTTPVIARMVGVPRGTFLALQSF